MSYRQRLKVIGYGLLGLFLLGAIATIIEGPEAARRDTWNSLTPEQRLSIVADCKEHPDTIRCQ
jgi:hypothetical protein